MKVKTNRIIVIALSLILLLTLIFAATMLVMAGETEKDKTETEETEAELEKIVLNKSAELKDKDKSIYTLNIESYVVGEVVWEEGVQIAPADIAVVLDQSSSMDETFTNGMTKQEALQAAVNSFITVMADPEKSGFDATEADHRIAIITFGDNASLAQGFTLLSEEGANSLKNTVNNLSIEYDQATRADRGMTLADNTLKNDVYESPNTKERNKYVILFTDGYPTSSSGFSTSVATNAIEAAKSMKDSGVEIFSIGIFEGAETTNLYGTSDYFGRHSVRASTVSDGSVGSGWKTKGETSASMPAANRFLNYISSNFPAATNIGLQSDDDTFLFFLINAGYKITANYERESDKFYYTADNASELTKSFQTVSQWIKYGGTSVFLDEKAVLKDIVSDYFRLPNETTLADIETYIVPCVGQNLETGEYLFEEDRTKWIVPGEGNEFKDVKVSINDFEKENDRRNISVTGFDYSTYYVGYDPVADKACGYKLVIKFDIKTINGFNGGNNIPTNNPGSGICPNEGSFPIKRLPEPVVNVPIPAPVCEIASEEGFVIYQGNEISADVIFGYDKVDPILDAFIERRVYLKIAGTETLVESDIFAPTTTQFYGKHTIVVKVRAKETATTEIGEIQRTGDDWLSVENEFDFTIFVLEPAVNVTMNDVTDFVGNTHVFGTGVNASASVVWAEPVVNGKTEDDASEVQGVFKPYSSSDLTVEFNIGDEKTSATVTKKDLVVTATPKLKLYDPEKEAYNIYELPDGATITNATTCSCKEGCTGSTDGTYRVHAQTCTLTIVNKGGEATEKFVYVIKKDGAAYMTVTVPGDGSVTVKNLSAGEYSAELVSDWSWRYTTTVEGKDNTTLSQANQNGTITFNNEKTNSSWVNDVSEAVVNVFGKAPAKEVVD